MGVLRDVKEELVATYIEWVRHGPKIEYKPYDWMKHELGYSMRGIQDPLKRDGRKARREGRLLTPAQTGDTWGSRESLRISDVGTPRELPYVPEDETRNQIVAPPPPSAGSQVPPPG